MNDEDIERYDADYRINPSGHKELVVKKKGKQDDETLSEIANELIDVIESMEFSGPLPSGGGAGSPEQIEYDRRHNDFGGEEFTGVAGDTVRINDESPNNMTMSTKRSFDDPDTSKAKSPLKANHKGGGLPNKYISGYRGDGLDNGATHSESFTGTGAIAIAPGMTTPINPEDDEDEEEDEDNTSESVMARSIIKEWEPKFAGGDYNPGDHRMQKPGGNGVAKRNPKREKVGSYDTDTSAQGEAWPRDHNETPAMCDVDEDGVENKPQGSHESSVGDPKDGHQEELGHNWPNEPSNSGSGVAEPFGGNRWSDGGTLQSGDGQSEGEISNKPTFLARQQQESWSPDNIGNLMEGDGVDLQRLFDSYARESNYVCLEDFENIVSAYNNELVLDEASLLSLMDNNRELVFHEGQDASGSYWVGVPVDDQLSESKENKRNGTINEFQTRSPEDEVGMSDFGSDDESGGDELDELGGDEFGGEFGDEGMDEPGVCPECGAPDAGEEECPECGCPVGGPDEFGYGGAEDRELEMAGDMMDMDDWALETGGLGPLPDDDENWEAAFPPGYSQQNPREILRRGQVRSPQAFESVKKFLSSAKNIVEMNHGDFSRKAIGNALQYSWDTYAGGVDPRNVPSTARKSIKKLMESYPFNPLLENDAMDKAGGSKIGGDSSVSNSEYLSEKDNPGPDEMEDHGDPFGASQENVIDTPVVKGTEKGMTGKGNYAKAVKENVNRLADYTHKKLRETAKGIQGKYGLSFSLLVQEGNGINRTNRRKTLAEALADAEEILQIHPHDNVVLESCFHQNGKVIRKADVPMLRVKKRGPLVSEGRALFRFKKNAEKFADELVNEGKPCRLMPHNWGHSVAAKVNYRSATKAFRAISESK